MLKWFDKVAETSVTAGQASMALEGAVVGYRTFASVLTADDTFYYTITAVDADGVPTGQWETGVGSLSGGTVRRDEVKQSSSNDAKVNFGEGLKRVTLSVISAAVESKPAVPYGKHAAWRIRATALVGGSDAHLELLTVTFLTPAGETIDGVAANHFGSAPVDYTRDPSRAFDNQSNTSYKSLNSIGTETPLLLGLEWVGAEFEIGGVQISAPNYVEGLGGGPTQFYIEYRNAQNNWIVAWPISVASDFWGNSGTPRTFMSSDIVYLEPVVEAPVDGTIYGRQDGEWVPSVPDGVVIDAPENGSMYARKDGTWVSFEPGGGGTGPSTPYGAHTRWRIQASSAPNGATDRFLVVREMRFFDAAQQLITVSGAGVSTIADSSKPAANAFDGDEATQFESQATYAANDFLLDLGFQYDTPVEVGAVAILAPGTTEGYANQPPGTFQVQYSDGGAWSTAWEITQNTWDGSPQTFVSPDIDPGAGGTLEDAPADGSIYGRQDNTWVEVPTGGGGGALEDAPADGSIYGRQDNTWVEVPTGGGGGSLPVGVENKILSVDAAGNPVWVDPKDGLGGTPAVTAPYGEHLYWRILHLTGNHSNYVVHSELTMRSTPGGAQRATGGTAIAGTSYLANTPNRAFDGDTGTYWESNGTPLVSGDNWLGYQFATPVSIVEVNSQVFGSEPTERVTSGKIQYSDNGAAWYDAWDFTGWAITSTSNNTTTSPAIGPPAARMWLAPGGGADAQLLAKASAADGDFEWVDAPTGGGSGGSGSGGALEVIALQAAPVSGVFDFTGLDLTAYSSFELELNELKSPAPASIQFQLRTSAGLLTTGYHYRTVSETTANASTGVSGSNVAQVDITSGTTGYVPADSTPMSAGIVVAGLDAGMIATFNSNSNYTFASGNTALARSGGKQVSTAQITGIRVYSGAALASGVAILRGYRKANAAGGGGGSTGGGAVKHRYWRLQYDQTNGNPIPELDEVSFRAVAGGPSVTTAGTAIADSGTAANAFGADIWTSTGSETTAWIGWDFGAGNEKAIVEVAVTASPNFPNRSPRRGRIQYSDDGTTWVTRWALYYADTWGSSQVRVYTDPAPEKVDAVPVRGARLRKTTTQSVPNTADTAITFASGDVERNDLNMFVTALNTRITALSEGWYNISGWARWDTATGGGRFLWLRKNGNVYATGEADGAVVDRNMAVSDMMYLAVNDYIELTAYQNSGGAVTITAASLTVVKI